MTIGNEIAAQQHQPEGEVLAEVLPSRRPRQEIALGQLREQVQALEDAKTWAEILCAPDNELCPAQYRGKVGSGIAAILYGAELGLNPTQSLQQVFVVHGMPAIYARTAVALCKTAGLMIETVSSADDSVTVKATDRTTGQIEQSTWNIDRAQRAGYTSNKKYTTDPQAMLYAKAAMEVCRKIAPDVLLGIPMSREELDLESQPVKVASDRGKGVSGLRSMIGAPPAPEQQPVEQPERETEAEPVKHQPDVRMASAKQLQKLSILRKEEKYDDTEEGRTGWFAWVEAALHGVKVDTNKDLTEDQAGELISILDTPKGQ